MCVRLSYVFLSNCFHFFIFKYQTSVDTLINALNYSSLILNTLENDYYNYSTDIVASYTYVACILKKANQLILNNTIFNRTLQIEVTRTYMNSINSYLDQNVNDIELAQLAGNTSQMYELKSYLIQILLILFFWLVLQQT